MPIVEGLLKVLFGFEGPRTLNGLVNKVKQIRSKKIRIFLEITHTTFPSLCRRDSTYSVIVQSNKRKFMVQEYSTVSYNADVPFGADKSFIIGATKEEIENKIEEVNKALQESGLETQILEPVIRYN